MKPKKEILLLLFLVMITAGSMGCGTEETEVSPKGLLTLETVVETLEKEGLILEKDHSKSPGTFALNGITPSVFKINNTEDTLLVYIGASVVDEEEIYGPFSFSLERVSFVARNALIVYMPSEIPESEEEIKAFAETRSLIYNTIFKYLNGGKEVIYKGESAHWEVTGTLEYYNDNWQDESGKQHYDGYHINGFELQYKMSNIDKVGPVSFEYERNGSSGSSTGLTLNDKGYTSTGSGGGNGWLLFKPEEEIYHITIKWNGKEEKIDLREQ